MPYAYEIRYSAMRQTGNTLSNVICASWKKDRRNFIKLLRKLLWKNGVEIINGEKQAHHASFPFRCDFTERRDDRQQRKKTPVHRGSFRPRVTGEPCNYKDIKLDERVVPTVPHWIFTATEDCRACKKERDV